MAFSPILEPVSSSDALDEEIQNLLENDND